MDLQLKSPFEKGGFRGHLRTSKRKEFVADAINPPPPGSLTKYQEGICQQTCRIQCYPPRLWSRK